MDDFDVLYKVILVGDAGVGKTNLLAYFTRHTDNDETCVDGVASSFHQTRKPTIGVEFGTKTILHPDGTRIRAQIWDTAGQERYRAITQSHYKRAAGAMVVYDVTNAKSLENAVNFWLPELKKAFDEESGIMSCIELIGNKIDLDNECQVDEKQHRMECSKFKLNGCRTSAKTGQNVSSAFKDLIISIHNQAKKKNDEEDYADSVVIGSEVANESIGCGC